MIFTRNEWLLFKDKKLLYNQPNDFKRYALQPFSK